MGQFDQELDPETGAPILTPDPSLDPLALLALSPPTSAPTATPATVSGPMPMPMGPLGPRAASIPLPIAPSAPPPPGALQHLIASALLGLAAGLGPRSAVGRGLSGGLEQNAEQARLAREQAFRDQQLQYHQQQEELLRQAQIGEFVRKNEEARSIQRAKTLDTIAKTVPSFETKDEYDRFIDQTGNLLVNSGFRDLSPVMLRSQFPFRPPDAKARAETALKKFFASPFTQDLIKQNGPMSVVNSKLDMGKDAEGRQNPAIPVLEALKLTGTEFPLDMNTSIPLEKLPESEQRIVAAKQQFFNETGRKPTKADDPEIYKRAREMMKNETDVELSRQLHELQIQGAESSNQLKAIQIGQQPTPEQIAMYGKLLVDHKMSPSQIQILGGGMGQQGRAFLRQVQEAALKQNPDFNFEEAESEYQLTKSPSFQSTVRYMDSTIESMPRVQAAANRLANGRVRAVNALINAGKNQVNNVDLKKFKADVLFVSDEIAKILQGGGTGSGTSDAKLRQASEILSTSDSPAAIAGALEEAAAMMGNRRRALTRGTYLERAAPNPAASAREELLRR